jgi:two-component system sensor histidine kinase ChiS
LLDVMMPHMSGFEVCQKIREQYTLTELPVIFITAKDQVMDLIDGLQHGGNDYITKPFSKQELIARVRTHLHLYKINDSYSRFIPFEFLESLGKEAIMEVNLGDHIEKNVTLMFSDIRDYTSLSEDMTPNENFEFLNSFLSKISPVIRDNNGFIMHYLGDGLMSIFLHDPADAINASVDMLSKIQEYNDLRNDAERKEIKMGIGLHTGKLVLGVLGDEGRLDLNVVSDSVNTASRMEGLTKTFGASIVMSEETLNGLDAKTKINYRTLGWVTVKGKTQPIKIFEVLDGLEKNELKIATKSTFEAGLAHYYKKDFISAASDFKQVATLNPDDVSADMYLKLAAKYMVDGVPEAWSGVEVMAHK